MPQKLDRELDTVNPTLTEYENISASIDLLSGKYTALQFEQLKQFLDHHKNSLKSFHQKILSKENPLGVEKRILLSLNAELLDALKFIKASFVQPRQEASYQQTLEAVDLLCAEGFQYFIKLWKETGTNKPSDEVIPIGPLVVLDSTRSPALWAEHSDLRFPSIFGPIIGDKTKRIPIPLIALPYELVKKPEFYPLLSHEVGHALDTTLDISNNIISKLGDNSQWKYWMREIVADCIALTLSGEAYAIALNDYIQRFPRVESFIKEHSYPPTDLRLYFVRQFIERSGRTDSIVLDQLPSEQTLKKYDSLTLDYVSQFEELFKTHFSNLVLPDQNTWSKLQQTILETSNGKLSDANPPELPFRLFPSIVSLAGLPERNEVFEKWHQAYDFENRSPWLRGQNNWSFTEQTLPTIRPTILQADGKTKVPPAALFVQYNKIALVGATQKWLMKAIPDAIQLRNEEMNGKPWESLEIFFASDILLKQVIYKDKDSRILTLEEKIQIRDKQEAELKTMFQAHKVEFPSVTFYRFDGPAIFGSFWDWDRFGGRIHLSAQLLGQDISSCPARDYQWSASLPTYEYSSYCQHLGSLREVSRVWRN